ncbi:MAG: hypothetical protein ACJ72M_06185 [Propionibacteriaceae bacterium]|jgi:hypothetical protein
MAEPPITQDQDLTPDGGPPDVPSPNKPGAGSRLRRRRIAASDKVRLARLTSLTGILFTALFVLSLIFFYTTPKLSASDEEITAYYTGGSTILVTVGLYLIPFAGIIFLWHAHAARLLIKSCTPVPSAIPYGLQLVSGVLFVVLLFAGMASAGSVALLKDLTNAPLPSADFIRGVLAVGYGMVFVYAIRGAGMYALTTTTLLRQARIMPTWLGVVSYLLAIFLLVSTTLHPVVVLLLPTWVVIIALVVFIRAGRVAEPAASERQST